MVGHDATELLIGAQIKTARTYWDPEMRGGANNASRKDRGPQTGARCQEQQILPVEG
jgi:hypothetical protein